MVGVSRLVLYRREHAVVLKARGKGIELWTLRYGDEVRNPRDIFDDLEERERDPKLLRVISELIQERKAPWSAEMVRDPVQERLSDLINEKKRGAARRPAAKPEAEEAPSNVVNIMDALRRSVAAESKTNKPRSPKGR